MTEDKSRGLLHAGFRAHPLGKRLFHAQSFVGRPTRQVTDVKLPPLALILLALAPLALAVPSEPPQDETLKVAYPLRSDGTTLYLSLCRGDVPETRDAAADDCLTSGLFQETNGEGHLQVRAGQYLKDGRLVSYAADARLLA